MSLGYANVQFAPLDDVDLTCPRCGDASDGFTCNDCIAELLADQRAAREAEDPDAYADDVLGIHPVVCIICEQEIDWSPNPPTCGCDDHQVYGGPDPNHEEQAG